MNNNNRNNLNLVKNCKIIINKKWILYMNNNKSKINN